MQEGEDLPLSLSARWQLKWEPILLLSKALSEPEWRVCCRTLWCPRRLLQNCRLRRALERFWWPALRKGLGAPCRWLVWSPADRNPDRRGQPAPLAVR